MNTIQFQNDKPHKRLKNGLIISRGRSLTNSTQSTFQSFKKHKFSDNLKISGNQCKKLKIFSLINNLKQYLLENSENKLEIIKQIFLQLLNKNFTKEDYENFVKFIIEKQISFKSIQSDYKCIINSNQSLTTQFKQISQKQLCFQNGPNNNYNKNDYIPNSNYHTNLLLLQKNLNILQKPHNPSLSKKPSIQKVRHYDSFYNKSKPNSLFKSIPLPKRQKLSPQLLIENINTNNIFNNNNKNPNNQNKNQKQNQFSITQKHKPTKLKLSLHINKNPINNNDINQLHIQRKFSSIDNKTHSPIPIQQQINNIMIINGSNVNNNNINKKHSILVQKTTKRNSNSNKQKQNEKQKQRLQLQLQKNISKILKKQHIQQQQFVQAKKLEQNQKLIKNVSKSKLNQQQNSLVLQQENQSLLLQNQQKIITQINNNKNNQKQHDQKKFALLLQGLEKQIEEKQKEIKRLGEEEKRLVMINKQIQLNIKGLELKVKKLQTASSQVKGKKQSNSNSNNNTTNNNNNNINKITPTINKQKLTLCENIKELVNQITHYTIISQTQQDDNKKHNPMNAAKQPVSSINTNTNKQLLQQITQARNFLTTNCFLQPLNIQTIKENVKLAYHSDQTFQQFIFQIHITLSQASTLVQQIQSYQSYFQQKQRKKLHMFCTPEPTLKKIKKLQQNFGKIQNMIIVKKSKYLEMLKILSIGI